jgi:formylmethanofuran dehydrogenase subunit E
MMKMNTIDPGRVSLKNMIERGVEFHGHLGPFLVLGIRMGLSALKQLGSTGYSNIRAEVRSGSMPPVSCLADGIQISTGCTLGKGNIVSLEMGKAEASFTCNGKNASYRVNDAILEQISHLTQDSLVDFSWKLSREPDEALFSRL